MNNEISLPERGTVVIDGLRVFAHHGVLPQERRAGNEFEVCVRLTVPCAPALLDDELDGTVNYAEAVEIITREMAEPSDLLEHVCHRIARALLGRWPQIEGGFVGLYKIHPPIACRLGRVGFEYRF